MIEKIVINGGKPLHGSVNVSGMKNAALPILIACILVKGRCVIENLPCIDDVALTLRLLQGIGVSVKMLSNNSVEIDATGAIGGISSMEYVRKMRASYYLIGAELGRFGRAYVGYPGGCDFGVRPIDQHIKGFKALGADVSVESGYIDATAANGLKGTNVFFDFITVGGTVNIMLAAVYAEGTTVIENAAREPHIVDLANFLNSCGAEITGAGTDTIKIKGVKSLHGCSYTIIPDMIEAGTYMIAAAATKGSVTIHNIIPKHLESITAKLIEMGVDITGNDESITVSCSKRLNAISVKTMPYPGFPTDMQPQMGVLLCLADGVSFLNEGVYDNRFRYVEELKRMGATVNVDGRVASICGVEKLSPASIRAVDLRAGAAMVIAALATEGTTVIEDIHHIERGYDDIVGKLRNLGADISKKSFPDPSDISIAN